MRRTFFAIALFLLAIVTVSANAESKLWKGYPHNDPGIDADEVLKNIEKEDRQKIEAFFEAFSKDRKTSPDEVLALEIIKRDAKVAELMYAISREPLTAPPPLKGLSWITLSKFSSRWRDTQLASAEKRIDRYVAASAGQFRAVLYYAIAKSLTETTQDDEPSPQRPTAEELKVLEAEVAKAKAIVDKIEKENR